MIVGSHKTFVEVVRDPLAVYWGVETEKCGEEATK